MPDPMPIRKHMAGVYRVPLETVLRLYEEGKITHHEVVFNMLSMKQQGIPFEVPDVPIIVEVYNRLKDVNPDSLVTFAPGAYIVKEDQK